MAENEASVMPASHWLNYCYKWAGWNWMRVGCGCSCLGQDGVNVANLSEVAITDIDLDLLLGSSVYSSCHYCS